MHLSSHGHFQSEWLSLWSLHDILAHSASFNGAFEAFGFVLARMKAGRQKHLHKWCFMWHKAMLVGHRLRHWCCKLRRMWKGLAHPQMYSGLKEGFLYTKTVLLSIVSRSKNNSGRETPYKLSIVWRKQKNLFKVSLHYRWLSGGPSDLLTWALLPFGLDMDVSSVGSGALEHCRFFWRDISQKLTAMDAAEWRRIHEDDVHVKLVFVWDYHGVSSSKGTLVGVWLFMLV